MTEPTPRTAGPRSGSCGLRETPLDVDEVLAALDDDASGGLTAVRGPGARPRRAARACVGLDYTAHPSALDRCARCASGSPRPTTYTASPRCTGSAPSTSATSRSWWPPTSAHRGTSLRRVPGAHRHPQGRGADLEAPAVRRRHRGVGRAHPDLALRPGRCGPAGSRVPWRHGRRPSGTSRRPRQGHALRAALPRARRSSSSRHGRAGGMPDLTQLFGQLQSMLQPYDGPLNWDVALDLARKTVAADPRPDAQPPRSRTPVADAVRLADHWLDETTGFPSGVTTASAWSRAEWVVNTTDVWKVLVEPVAQQSVGAMGSALPEEAQAQAGADPRHPRPRDRRAARQPGRLRPRHPGRRGALASPTSASRWPRRARPPWSRPTSRPSPRASTSPRTTSCSTSRCARPPTSGCSPASRGCATTWSAR